MATHGKSGKTPKRYCICKQTLHGTKMIACEGGCENWFHLTCIDMAATDADIVASFICEECVGNTTFKRLCRLPGCMKPHEVVDIHEGNGTIKRKVSKYCSAAHCAEFWDRTVASIDPDFAAQLSTAIRQVPMGKFKELGTLPTVNEQEIKSGPPYNDDGMFFIDTRIRDDLKKNIASLGRTVMNLTNRLKLISLIKKYSDETIKQYSLENNLDESNLKRKKGGSRFVCGYDPRLAATDRSIASYMERPEGIKAWETGVFEDYSDFNIDIDPEYYKGVCVRLGSKPGCTKHTEWYDTHYNDTIISKERNTKALVKESEKLQELYDRIQRRLAIERARDDYVKFRLGQMSEEAANKFQLDQSRLMGDPDWVIDKLLKEAFPEGMDHLEPMELDVDS